jgi:hypothetical protein
MLISKKLKLSTLHAAALLLTLAMPTLVLPASAQSSRYDAGMGDNHQPRKRPVISQAARNASDMEIGSSFGIDPNSPQATGGGSLGYNRKLLEY